AICKRGREDCRHRSGRHRGRGGGLPPARQPLLHGDRRVRERRPARQGEPGAGERRLGRHGLGHRDRPERKRRHPHDPQRSAGSAQDGHHR
ncbi:MAG: hypothetical protein AVDCRST_MAG17-256, partial [uncultured Solirubrobacterales bacterium]